MKMIKYISLVFLILGSSIMGANAEDEFRVFTSTAGKTIEARILEYNPSRNKLRIERRGKGSTWVGADVFCASDREYIREWVFASMFQSSSNLRITLKKETIQRSGSKKSLEKTERIGFEVKLQNRSKQSMDHLRIEYRYFLKGEEKGSGNAGDKKGSLKLASIKPGAYMTCNTNPLALITKYRTQQESSTDIYGIRTYSSSIVKTSEDQFRGIWVRLYGPKVEGKALYRDVTYPTNLSELVAW